MQAACVPHLFRISNLHFSACFRKHTLFVILPVVSLFFFKTTSRGRTWKEFRQVLQCCAAPTTDYFMAGTLEVCDCIADKDHFDDEEQPASSIDIPALAEAIYWTIQEEVLSRRSDPD
jgi:hypothetical protein